MKMSRHLILGVTAVASSLAVAGVGATAFKNADIKAPLGAGAAPTTRRVWVYEDGQYEWGVGANNVANFTVYAFGGKAAATDYKAFRTHDDYYGGLYYADIPADCSTVIVRTGMQWGGDKQTEDCVLPAFGSRADVLKVSYVKDMWTKRSCTLVNAPMGDGQVQHLLRFYNTCSDSQALGYMAYPQLMKNFIEPSTLNMSLEVYKGSEEQGYNGKLPTIGEKLDAMKAKYLAHK